MSQVIKSVNVRYGKSATPPSDSVIPTYEDSTFNGWDSDEYKNVTRNLNIHTVYQKKIFTVYFKYLGKTFEEESRIVGTQKVIYGHSAVSPSMNPIEGYNFQWGNCSNIKNDVTIEGDYYKDSNYFYVKFYKKVGSSQKLISEQVVKKGASAIVPSQKEIDESDPSSEGYVMKGWSCSFDNITKDTDVYTVYVEKELFLSLQCSESSTASYRKNPTEYKFAYTSAIQSLKVFSGKSNTYNLYTDTFSSLNKSSSSKLKIICKATDKSDSIKEIAEKCFYCSGAKCYLDYAYFPEVTTIKKYAFYKCSYLTFAYFPKVTAIEANAFYICSSLTDASFGSVVSIGSSAFYRCTDMTKVSVPKAISLGNQCFYQCSGITSIDLSSVTSIGTHALYGLTSLTSIQIPKLTEIGTQDAIYGKNLQSISLNAITSICNKGFYTVMDKMTELYIPKIQSIGTDGLKSFKNGLTKITLNASKKDELISKMQSSGIWGVGKVKDGKYYNTKGNEITVIWE